MSDMPTDFSKLPTVSFVVPNLCHDMHDCSVKDGDHWLAQNIDPYARWARTHNSLLILRSTSRRRTVIATTTSPPSRSANA